MELGERYWGLWERLLGPPKASDLRHRDAVVSFCFPFSVMLAQSQTTDLSVSPITQARHPGDGHGLSGKEGAPESQLIFF